MIPVFQWKLNGILMKYYFNVYDHINVFQWTLIACQELCIVRLMKITPRGYC